MNSITEKIKRKTEKWMAIHIAEKNIINIYLFLIGIIYYTEIDVYLKMK